MRTVDYPSDELPAVPCFTIGVPDGYTAHAAPGMLAVVEPVARQEPFQPNVTVTADVVPAGISPVTVLDRVVAETVNAYPGTEVGARHELADAPAASQHLRVDGGIDQVLTVFVAPTHAFTVASTWRGDTHGAELRPIHESFRIK